MHYLAPKPNNCTKIGKNTVKCAILPQNWVFSTTLGLPATY